MSALFGKLCRTCLDTPETLYAFKTKCVISGTSVVVQDLIQEVLVSVLDLNADLPEQICTDCLKELMRTSTFLEKCRSSESALSTMVSASRRAAKKKDLDLDNIQIAKDETGKDDIVVLRFSERPESEKEDTKCDPFPIDEPEDLNWTKAVTTDPVEDALEDMVESNIQMVLQSPNPPKVLNKIPTTSQRLTRSQATIQLEELDIQEFPQNPAESEGMEDGEQMEDHGDNYEEAERNEELEIINEEVPEYDSEVLLQGIDERSCEDDGVEEHLVRTSSSIDSNSLTCPDCGIAFIHPKSLENHIKKQHSTSSEEYSESSTHTDPKPQKGAFNCPKCHKSWGYKKSLLAHIRKNQCETPSKLFCCVCDREFARAPALANHMKTHEGKVTLKSTNLFCTICPESEREIFQELADLLNHFNQHRKLATYICDDCGRCFTMASTLKDHRRTHTGQRPFACTYPGCDKAFSQAPNLKQHLARHQQLKDHKCSVPDCGSAFVTKAELVAHMRKHTGEHPFNCDECNAGFTTASSLLKHKRQHTGEKPYICEVCKKAFRTLNLLKSHQNTHKEVLYPCEKCPEVFKSIMVLSAHRKSHKGEKAFECSICGATFRYATALKDHTWVEHGMTNEGEGEDGDGEEEGTEGVEVEGNTTVEMLIEDF